MKKHRIVLNAFTALVIVALSVPVFLRYPPAGSVNWFFMNLLLALFVMRWPATLVHELGHALVARATGLQVIAVAIGVGRPIVNFMIGPTRVAICAVGIGLILPEHLVHTTRQGRLTEARRMVKIRTDFGFSEGTGCGVG